MIAVYAVFRTHGFLSKNWSEHHFLNHELHITLKLFERYYIIIKNLLYDLDCLSFVFFYVPEFKIIFLISRIKISVSPKNDIRPVIKLPVKSHSSVIVGTAINNPPRPMTEIVNVIIGSELRIYDYFDFVFLAIFR